MAASQYPVVRPGPPRASDGERLRYGGCSCGVIRFELKGEPLKVGVCHCMECRKATGAIYVTYADWPRSAFTVSGDAREYQGRSFCSTCGSRVFHLSEHEVEIMVGALDDAPSDLRPTREGWIKRREVWLVPIGAARQFEEDPV